MKVDNSQTAYPSKRDAWLGAVLWGGVVAVFCSALTLWSTA